MYYKNPELIVMLTHNDRTVENASQIFEQCKDAEANMYGLKKDGLPFEQMKKLFFYMKECGKVTILEVIAYTEEECMSGARMAVDCECDILMGTLFFDSVNEFCSENDLKYMPFVGKVTGCPSILEGTIEGMIAEANKYLEKGVYGIDLLGYRYTGDPVTLSRKLISQVHAPICLAGSINSYKKLDEVITCGSWAFAIGGAFFENKFGRTYNEQISKVCKYVGEHQVAG